VFALGWFCIFHSWQASLIHIQDKTVVICPAGGLETGLSQEYLGQSASPQTPAFNTKADVSKSLGTQTHSSSSRVALKEIASGA